MAEELVVGTIVGVAEQPGARAPSLLLTLDLGAYGREETVLPTGSYDAAELEGAQIVCRRETDGALVIGAHSHGTGFVLLRPTDEVEPGGAGLLARVRLRACRLSRRGRASHVPVSDMVTKV